jgi:predicted transcriptional regulator
MRTCLHLHAAAVAAGADAQEGDTVAVRRVHVRLDLEHEAGELVLFRVHHAAAGLARTRRRRVLDEGVEQLLDAEVVDRGAEEHRGLLAAR